MYQGIRTYYAEKTLIGIYMVTSSKRLMHYQSSLSTAMQMYGIELPRRPQENPPTHI